MGSNKRHLGAPGEKEFSGKGVTYCATCDAFFYKGKDVAVLGTVTPPWKEQPTAYSIT